MYSLIYEARGDLWSIRRSDVQRIALNYIVTLM